MKLFLKFFNRKHEDVLPPGEFEAPKYDLRKDSHNGYHLHILVRKKGKYVQSDYAVTVIGNLVVAFCHGNSNSSVHFDESTLRSKNFLKNIEPLIRAKVKSVHKDEWRKFSKAHLIALFHL